MILRLLRRADREAEGARLLSEYAPKGHLGFESPALRQYDLIKGPNRDPFSLSMLLDTRPHFTVKTGMSAERRTP